MQVRTTRFGNVEIAEDRVIMFPNGLLGFSDYTRFCLLEPSEDACFFWLQSLDDPALATAWDETEWGDGNTPLHYSAYNGHLELCRMLCGDGEGEGGDWALSSRDVNQPNSKEAGGVTPLFMACQQGHAAVVEYLPIDRRLRRSIAAGGTLDELRTIARSGGLVSLRSRALELVREGVIAFSSLPRFIPLDRLVPGTE